MIKMTEFPEIMTDGNIELRRPAATFDNARAMYDLIDKNREYLGEFLGWPEKTKSPEDSFAFLTGAVNGKSNWTIYVDGKLAGDIGFVKVEPGETQRRCEIGYWISAEFAGRGVITRCVRLLERAAFERDDINRRFRF